MLVGLGTLSVCFSLLFLFAMTSDFSLNEDSYGPIELAADPNQKTLEKLPTCMRNTATLDRYQPSREQWEQCLDPGTKPSVYLSIVIVTRMDDYAGGQYHRFQNFIDSAFLLAEHTKEHIELLIVEWNPPKDKRRIVDVFRFRHSNYLSYRIITVPKKIHDFLPNRGNSPLHEFEGKNVGIRFARGEFIVCTNQDDIWSHNFHNAIKSRVFKKNVIYLQYQAPHNIHENFPPSIVDLPAFPDDDTLYNACRLEDQNWGHYQLPEPIKVTTDRENNFILNVADQAGDFTLAHRDTWKVPRGYREKGGVAWMDIEFICTATWTFDIPVVYSDKSFCCHQQHNNVWEANTEQHNDNTDVNMGDIERKEKSYMNEDGQWALQQVDIWDMGLECLSFYGGLCW
ncbi:hypothetical protein DM01DRAFT_1333432 [Hesseltinella vesiculosa]|uniref:Glycosyltransferase 2-like domain-containing protein n=1 Tax=Hesseltinella vesiculosa TaxID=101127 RepID=A0A1X2GQ13_9FUNG|nr:hypothetical protein DM01DRAFT_1333432 [Hesseltinella vesiculosa]